MRSSHSGHSYWCSKIQWWWPLKMMVMTLLVILIFQLMESNWCQSFSWYDSFFFLTSFWRVEFCCVGKYLADQKLRATFCLNNSIEMETLTLQKCILLKQIFLQLRNKYDDLFCAEEIFWKKRTVLNLEVKNAFRKLTWLNIYIFTPKLLETSMPTKTSRKRMRSRGARKEYATYGGKFSFFDWNSTKQYAAFAIHTLIFRWAPFNLKLRFAIFFRTFSIEFSANSKMENIEIKRINNCAGVLHPSFFLCMQILRYHSEFYFPAFPLHSLPWGFRRHESSQEVLIQNLLWIMRVEGAFISLVVFFFFLALSSQRVSIITPQQYHLKKFLTEEKVSQMSM